MHSSSTRELALKLRLRGKSYNEICQIMAVSKSTLHAWLFEVQLSKDAQKRLSQRVRSGALKGLLKRNNLQTHKARQRAQENRKIGKKMIPQLSKENLLVTGAALYWGEGYKKNCHTWINKNPSSSKFKQL